MKRRNINITKCVLFGSPCYQVAKVCRLSPSRVHQIVYQVIRRLDIKFIGSGIEEFRHHKDKIIEAMNEKSKL